MVSLPSGIQAGDRLIIWIGGGAQEGDPFTHTDWDVLETVNGASGHAGATLLERIADGSEGSTVTLTRDTTAGETVGAIALRITGSDTATAMEWTEVSAGGITSTRTFAALAPSWGSKDTLWVALALQDVGGTVSAWPSDYTDNRLQARGTTSNGAGVALATREYTGTTDTPGNLVWSNANRGGTITLAIAPGTISSPVTIDTPGSGTFTAPATASYLVETWGGGAGGGGFDTGTDDGPGGGGGAYSAEYVNLTAGDTCDWVVGAGGAAGAADTIGSDGGDSEFENDGGTVVVRAKGGDAGVDLVTGGVGGDAGSGIGSIKYSGGNGHPDGGGGSSAGTAANGNSATDYLGATAPTDGGDGGQMTVPGFAPGGGGGGGNWFTAENAQAGAPGKLRITWPASAGGQPIMARWGAVPHMKHSGHRIGGGWR